jgi:GNAT superfamily N-acetyltransferase
MFLMTGCLSKKIESIKEMNNSKKSEQKSGSFRAQDKTGRPVILEWLKTDMASLEYVTTMKSVLDIACPTYTKVEVEFLRAHPEVVGKEDYFKPFEPLFKDGVASVDWHLVEQKMQEILTSMFIIDVSVYSDDMKKKLSTVEQFFISVKDEKTGTLLGFVQFLITPEYAEGDIKGIAFAVRPEVQNRGLGKLLVSSILKILPDLKRIFLCTRITNIIAQKAYYNWGFTNEIDPVIEEHRYTFNVNHWIFLEYKIDQATVLQKTAATLIDTSLTK